MKAIAKALIFCLVCVGTYYITVVFLAPKETLSLDKTSKRGSRSPNNIPQAQADIPEKPGKVPEIPKGADEAVQDILQPAAKTSPLPNEHVQPVTETPQPHPLARGWGDEIDWSETYEGALLKSRSSQKPLMVIHHLEDCPVSKALKTVFSANKEIQRMAKENFVMFNLLHETEDPNLAPDGYYVPRIIFIDPSLTVRTEITGKSKKYKYAYSPEDIQTLYDNMKRVRLLLNTEL
ncbi:anterior gradient protein 3-like [Lepisosteus oculatus]